MNKTFANKFNPGVNQSTSTINDTPYKIIFDSYLKLAATVCNTPIAGINYIGREGKRFKAIYGFEDLLNLPANISFRHRTEEALLGFFQIQDLRQDKSSATHSLVTDSPGLRFYASAPLTLPNGHRIGSFYVLDYQVRTLNAYEQQSLQQLAEVIIKLIALQREQEHLIHFGKMLEQSTDGICILDAKTLRVEYANETAQHYLGWTTLELLNMTPGHYKSPADYAAFKTAIKPLYDEQQTHIDIETVNLRKGGAPFISEERLQLWKNGTQTKLLVAFKDITERKQMAQSLMAREHHLSAVLETLPEGIKILSKTGELLDVTPAGLKMLEADNLTQARSKPFIDYLKPAYRPRFKELLAQVFNGVSGRLEYEMVGLKGGQHWLEMIAVPLCDESGNIVKMLSSTRDISLRKTAEIESRNQEATIP